ncbi:hypothetical protein M9H77_02810 [Catharanthus roseus]|uniref:Uncharacterized protein n=1 Tax=Catharanthus roseus TaxID=4058 RepID=A0ACC0C9Q7_CATRO|nr:hypothetical protein M9H77_02810 [Catharanthus roseus]
MMGQRSYNPSIFSVSQDLLAMRPTGDDRSNHTVNSRSLLELPLEQRLTGGAPEVDHRNCNEKQRVASAWSTNRQGIGERNTAAAVKADDGDTSQVPQEWGTSLSRRR